MILQPDFQQNPIMYSFWDYWNLKSIIFPNFGKTDISFSLNCTHHWPLNTINQRNFMTGKAITNKQCFRSLSTSDFELQGHKLRTKEGTFCLWSQSINISLKTTWVIRSATSETLTLAVKTVTHQGGGRSSTSLQGPVFVWIPECDTNAGERERPGLSHK